MTPLTGTSRARVLAELERSAGMTRLQLARALGLPKTTVAGAVDELLERGDVVEHEAEPVPGRRGRRPRLVAVAGPERVVAAFLWSPVELRVSVAGFGGDVRGQRAIGVEGPRQGTAGLDPAVGLLDDALGDAGLATTNVAFAVLGVPTPLQPGAGPPGAFATSLREDPARELGRRLGIPTRAENDANLGALGEAAFGAGRGLDSFVYVKLAPHGLGCGLILAGRLFRGATGFAGELGHVQLREDGPLCACGGRGCLVGMLGPSLIDLVQPAYERSLGFADLLELAAADEVGPARMLEDLGRAIGRPLADLCTVLNPAAIVLDGSLGPAGRHVIAGMRHLIDRHSPPVTAEAARVIPGVLGERAEALGAVALARGVGVGDA